MNEKGYTLYIVEGDLVRKYNTEEFQKREITIGSANTDILVEANTISKAGKAKLEQELEYLITVRKKEVADQLKEARSFGDLSENAEYDEAKNEQAIMEARINQIESILKTAVIIDESETSNENVHLTSKVKIEILESGMQAEYTIVGSGSNEADPGQGKISDESPIGAALMGKSVGDVAEVETPGGVLTVKVLEISK